MKFHPTQREDEHFMSLALREAAKGLGHTSPNPAVGAVIVRAGRVIASGYHRAAGQPHAEIEALGALGTSGKNARGATIYVTLEPCSTHGRTPPCTTAILEAGLARVVIGATDPNPNHAGRARTLLEARGIQVTGGVLEEKCRGLNQAFNRWIVTATPWVIAKAAITLDGRITRPPGEGQWLSGPVARASVHELRSRVDAILIGAGTLRADNPRLTVRDAPNGPTPPKQPWRVVLSRSGNLPSDAHLFTDEHRDRTLVFRDQPIQEILQELGRRQIASLMIEGGGKTLEQFFSAGLVDEVWFYLTPLVGGGPNTALNLSTLNSAGLSVLGSTRYVRLGDDVLLHGEVRRPLSPT